MYVKKNRPILNSISRKQIYIEISEPFYVEPQAAAKIIFKMLKNGYVPSKIEISDFIKKFNEIHKVQNILNPVL